MIKLNQKNKILPLISTSKDLKLKNLHKISNSLFPSFFYKYLSPKISSKKGKIQFITKIKIDSKDLKVIALNKNLKKGKVLLININNPYKKNFFKKEHVIRNPKRNLIFADYFSNINHEKNKKIEKNSFLNEKIKTKVSLNISKKDEKNNLISIRKRIVEKSFSKEKENKINEKKNIEKVVEIKKEKPHGNIKISKEKENTANKKENILDRSKSKIKTRTSVNSETKKIIFNALKKELSIKNYKSVDIKKNSFIFKDNKIKILPFFDESFIKTPAFFVKSEELNKAMYIKGKSDFLIVTYKENFKNKKTYKNTESLKIKFYDSQKSNLSRIKIKILTKDIFIENKKKRKYQKNEKKVLENNKFNPSSMKNNDFNTIKTDFNTIKTKSFFGISKPRNEKTFELSSNLFDLKKSFSILSKSSAVEQSLSNLPNLTKEQDFLIFNFKDLLKSIFTPIIAEVDTHFISKKKISLTTSSSINRVIDAKLIIKKSPIEFSKIKHLKNENISTKIIPNIEDSIPSKNIKKYRKKNLIRKILETKIKKSKLKLLLPNIEIQDLNEYTNQDKSDMETLISYNLLLNSKENSKLIQKPEISELNSASIIFTFKTLSKIGFYADTFNLDLSKLLKKFMLIDHFLVVSSIHQINLFYNNIDNNHKKNFESSASINEFFSSELSFELKEDELEKKDFINVESKNNVERIKLIFEVMNSRRNWKELKNILNALIKKYNISKFKINLQTASKRKKKLIEKNIENFKLNRDKLYKTQNLKLENLRNENLYQIVPSSMKAKTLLTTNQKSKVAKNHQKEVEKRKFIKLSISEFIGKLEKLLNENKNKTFLIERMKVQISPPDIGKMEFEIRKIGERLFLEFKVEDKKSENILKNRISEFVSVLKDSGYEISQIKIERFEENNGENSNNSDHDNNNNQEKQRKHNEERKNNEEKQQQKRGDEK